MTCCDSPDAALTRLLQIASPALPVGAYAYSEGLERAVEDGHVRDADTLHDWIDAGLSYGSVVMEAAVLARVHAAWNAGDEGAVRAWNAWLGAARESAELYVQSVDMGNALCALLRKLPPPLPAIAHLRDCHFAVAFALAAAHWGIPTPAAVTAYVHAWAANLVSAGVKLVPLGQTAGQRILWIAQDSVARACAAALTMSDDDLATGSAGMALASIAHERQYTRLFRS